MRRLHGKKAWVAVSLPMALGLIGLIVVTLVGACAVPAVPATEPTPPTITEVRLGELWNGTIYRFCVDGLAFIEGGGFAIVRVPEWDPKCGKVPG
jgi:hypothetical protein